jgi:hypothetical protein
LPRPRKHQGYAPSSRAQTQQNPEDYPAARTRANPPAGHPSFRSIEEIEQAEALEDLWTVNPKAAEAQEAAEEKARNTATAKALAEREATKQKKLAAAKERTPAQWKAIHRAAIKGEPEPSMQRSRDRASYSIGKF